MKVKLLFSISTIFLLAACSQPDGKQAEIQAPQSYTSNEIGWTVDIPAGFKLTSQARIIANDQKGKEAIGKVLDGQVKLDSLTHLVSFGKNQFNLFDSTIEPYVEDRPGDYATNNQLIKNLLYQTYNKQGIKIDTSSNQVEVDGRRFYAFYIQVLGPNGSVVMNQIMFNQMINGYDFGVNITYNNEEDKKHLLDAFKHSRFRLEQN